MVTESETQQTSKLLQKKYMGEIDKLNAYIRKQQKIQINNLSFFYLKKLEKNSRLLTKKNM